MNRPHYFCHISLMLLSTAALAQAAPQAAPMSSAPDTAQPVPASPQAPAAT